MDRPHTEDTRVKIPAILHLIRLGYEYLSLKGASWDTDTNIFPDIFIESICRINPDMDKADANRFLEEAKLTLDNEDLGEAFFKMLQERSGNKLIDFDNFNNNQFHVVTELTYKNGDDEFRPDITLLINGMPLVFIEVKKPNNRDGVLAERARINTRFQNKKFRRFVNLTQLMIFSNNMEYDDHSPEPIQGAFYASPSYYKPVFNYFREEKEFDLNALLRKNSDDTELTVLKDNNLEVIRSNPEFTSNKEPGTPTNRICTSLLSRKRLPFVLQYALAYVHEHDGIQKHVMRYPQLFATKAIEQKLEQGTRKGIIWHTQGSGKTALTYYNVKFLTDYYQKKNIVPKFYFIVDRLDLLKQAKREFSARGLKVHTINSREEFSRDIKATKVIHNDSGKAEITVVNIQKFEDDPDVVQTKDYNVDIQRVYFLDEVHRSYNPKGSFLANLDQSDRNAIKIGLTGTPLLGTDYNSRQLFGGYIHKYYYNASIADGYTLRLIREEIATKYKMALQQALKELEVQQGKIDKKKIYAHPRFVAPMLDYIITDFENSRGAMNDASIGGMVICDSSEQAKELYKQFMEQYAEQPTKAANDEEAEQPQVAEAKASYSVTKAVTQAVTRKEANKVKTAALILHDVGSKDERDDWIEDFKAGKIDFLFVYNMLLTGFDAKRLKKLYLGRVIRQHNLLQALTRVNRTYKQFRYGYVVDFADIQQEFKATNEAYFKELQEELGDELEHYSNLFKTQEEIKAEIDQVKDVLFKYDTENPETFSRQISEMEDRKAVLALKKALADAKSLYNVIRMQADYDLLNCLDFPMLNKLYRMASDRLDMLNLKESIEKGDSTTNLLNVALEEVLFEFIKVGEEELKLADELKNTLQKTREALNSNFDQQDPKFVTLKEELERLFKKKKLSEVTQSEMNQNIVALNKIHDKVKELNRENNLLRQKYKGDRKYTRIHKRLNENNPDKPALSANERKIFDALISVKVQADDIVLNNSDMLDNDSYFERTMMPHVIREFKVGQNIPLNPDAARHINKLIVNEYLNEYNGGQAW